MANFKSSLKSIAKNPLTYYGRFLVNWWRNTLKFKHYSQGYLSLVINCQIGEHVKIYDYVKIVDSEIGSFSYISPYTLITETKIGKFCCIGCNCKMGLGTHPPKDFVSSHPTFFSTKKQAGVTFSDGDYFPEKLPITIGNDVWIGANVIILDGVNIGDGAIIAAGAVVNKDVPPYSIYGGVPAKFIRHRFDENSRDFLTKFKWWDRDEEWLKNNFKDFHNIDDFVKKYLNEL
jgi:acetyltransferase-like isoleucine patch superfamily enzyme